MTTTDDQTPMDTTEADGAAGVSCAAAYGSAPNEERKLCVNCKHFIKPTCSTVESLGKDATCRKGKMIDVVTGREWFQTCASMRMRIHGGCGCRSPKFYEQNVKTVATCATGDTNGGNNE